MNHPDYWKYAVEFPNNEADIEKRLAWCRAYCEGLYTERYYTWDLAHMLFTHEQDAVAFRLAWGTVEKSGGIVSII